MAALPLYSTYGLGFISQPPPAGVPQSPTLSNNYSLNPKTIGPNSPAKIDLAVLLAQANLLNSDSDSPMSGAGVGVIGDGLAPTKRDDQNWDRHSLHRALSSRTSSPGPPRSAINHNFPTQYESASRFTTPVPPAPAGYKDASTDVNYHLNALNSLIAPMLASQDELERLKKEVDMWKGEWGRSDKEKRRLEALVDQTEKDKSSKPKSGLFSAVLIDGDRLVFQDNLLKDGFKGGQAAANELLSILPNLSVQAQLLPQLAGEELAVDADGDTKLPKSHAGEVPDLGSVIVHLFINKQGLGHALVKAGAIPSWGVFDQFLQGFSSSHKLFTVIDVGFGKEASDDKIKEYLKLYAMNTHCDMIVLGASHDKGYANTLSSLEIESRISKLFLLKGYSELAPQLRQYTSRVVSVPDLFRSTRLQSPALSLAPLIVPTTPPSPVSSFSAALQKPTPAPLSKIRAPLERAESIDSDESVDIIEWGVVHNEKETKLSKQSGKSDESWETAAKKLKPSKGKPIRGSVRDLEPRPCHTFYLSAWGCKAGDTCNYEHTYKLTVVQLEELHKLAKDMVCPFARQNKCHFAEEDCVYGHHCPRGSKCTFGQTCRFNVLSEAHALTH